MPTYEYRCANGHAFEQFQRISDSPIDVCPQCGAAAERILSGGAGLLFKGSGFYITDYRSDSYKKAAESDRSGTGTSSAGEKGGAGKDAAGDGSSAAGGSKGSKGSKGSTGSTGTGGPTGG